MMRSGFLTVVVLVAFFTAAAYAGSVDILGMQVPLIEGAELIKADSGKTKEASISTYFVDQDVSVVTNFYRMFFIKNDFQLIGADMDSDFNVSVKKAGVMFGLKIYRQNERTLIQFIW